MIFSSSIYINISQASPPPRYAS